MIIREKVKEEIKFQFTNGVLKKRVRLENCKFQQAMEIKIELISTLASDYIYREYRLIFN